MTILATYAPTGARTWNTPHADRHSAREARHWTTEQLTDLHIPADTIDAAALIVSELLANVALHAPGEAQITLHPDGGLLAISCADRGPLPVDFTPRDDDEHGRGLLLVDALCHDRRFTRHRASGGKRIIVLLTIGEQP